jgi:hypothetical protein
MPSSPGYVRDYKQEYANYQGKKEQIDKRSSRNKARRALAKEGRVRLGDGMDVDHKNTNAKDNSKDNLRVKPKSSNRSFPRNKKAGKK